MAYIRIETDGDIAIIWLDQEGQRVNTLAPDMFDEFERALDEVKKLAAVKGAVLISAKTDSFIAGADLGVFEQMEKPGQAEAMSRRGHHLLNQMADFPKPIVAAIHGAALGGGLEVALACHYRIATDHEKTVLGLPEVKLGLLPGGGGTQRLPKLIGLQRALDIMLTGKNIYPRQAKRMGLVDLVVHPYGLQRAATLAIRDLAAKRSKRKRRRSLGDKMLELTPIGRRMVYKKARQMVQKQTRGNYPAPVKIIECVEAGMEKGFKAGSETEAKKFDELMFTPQCRQLIRLFFAMNGKKKNPLAKQVRPVAKIGILGAGLMGAGIAQVSIDRGYDVIIKDRDAETLGRGEKSIWQELEGKRQKRIISRFERDRIFSRLTSVLDDQAFRASELVIEAVFEDLELKRKMLAAIETVTGAGCIFASNTSSLPISDIANKAKRPENVIGMHYFSPVPKMPLLELVVTKKTASWVTATAIEVGIRQGKTVIVVQDGPGFYTTRILAPLMHETLALLQEGADVKQLDQAMLQFGFPVGPVMLMDEVGLDVAAHVTGVLGGLFKARGIETNPVSQQMYEQEFYGRKNRRGFYVYDKSGKRKKGEVNLEVYRFFGGPARKPIKPAEIQERLSLVMVNEAVHCLQEEILASAEDGDLGAVLGLGFPPFLGGPFRYADSLGAGAMVAKLQAYEQRFGARFTPAARLLENAKKKRGFYKA